MTEYDRLSRREPLVSAAGSRLSLQAFALEKSDCSAERRAPDDLRLVSSAGRAPFLLAEELRLSVGLPFALSRSEPELRRHMTGSCDTGWTSAAGRRDFHRSQCARTI